MSSSIEKMADKELENLGIKKAAPAQSKFEWSTPSWSPKTSKSWPSSSSSKPKWEPAKTSAEPTNIFARLQNLGKTSWMENDEGFAEIDPRDMDRAVTIFRSSIIRWAELFGMECVDERSLYLDIEAMLMTHFEVEGMGPVIKDNEAK